MLDATRSRTPATGIGILSIFKSFHTSEKTTLEFRSEFFNVLNHTNFLLPSLALRAEIMPPSWERLSSAS
jgi:hypothetical protein